MHLDSIYVLNIENFLGLQKLKEDSSNRKGTPFPPDGKPRPFNLGFYFALLKPLQWGFFCFGKCGNIKHGKKDFEVFKK
jgi:hypothetical protein